MLIDTLYESIKLFVGLNEKYANYQTEQDCDTYFRYKSLIKQYKQWLKDEITFNAYFEKKYTQLVSYEKSFNEVLETANKTQGKNESTN